MNLPELQPWVLGLILGTVGGLIVLQFVWDAWLKRKAKDEAKPVPGASVPMTYVGEVNPLALGLAVNQALELLVRLGPWPRETLFGRLTSVEPVLSIQKTNLWFNSAGQKVGGETVGNVLRVGKDLSALCHELAHLSQMVSLGITDHSFDPKTGKHPGWDKSGLDQADQAYRSWLKVQP